eukprot:TRINITY_DN16569_c0_g1_i1.p1 TRINITY_DN16569_c0_g1~~TRINITY_DN16569_c0_g1_i1.p1  ORF type:complete len:543 (+),score=240.40 TRINITY_DN16569_c0_g1_i1:89-1717(+)
MADAPRKTSLRRTSLQCQSAPMRPGQQYTLVDGTGRGNKSSSRANYTRKDKGGAKAEWVKHEHWWQYESILHLVYEFVGVQQVFCGRSVDDEQKLFEMIADEAIKPACLTSKHWNITSRSMTQVDLRPIRYSLTDAGLAKALKVTKKASDLCLADCRRVKFLLPMFTLVGKNITVLNLVGCSHLTDATLGVLTGEMPKLRELYVPACPKLEFVSVTKPISGESDLHTLDISANLKVSDDALERVFRDHPNIKELFASQCEKISNPKVSSKNLELVNLDGCENITFNSVMAFLKRCPNVKYVTLGDNDKMLEEEGKRFAPLYNIVELNISAIYQDDDTVNSVLDNLPNLKLLDASNSEFVVSPKLVHTELEVLVVNMCSELNEKCFEDINTGLPQLKHLSANHCDNLIRPQIKHNKLEVLDFSACDRLLSDKVFTPWLSCPALQQLFIGHNSHITDREIQLLPAGLPVLEELNMFQVGHLVKPNILSWQSLQSVNVMNCWNIQDEWIEEIDEKLENLHTIFMNIDEDDFSDDEFDEGGDPHGW